MRPKLSLRDELEQLFEKKFLYQKPSEGVAWHLPEKGQSIFSEFYQFGDLQRLKENLNAVKSKLNDYGTHEWSTHTNKRDPSGEVVWRLKNETKAEFVTVAWCKFFECLNRFPLIGKSVVNTLHLCEAPGAFIAALNHYMHTTYKAEEIKWNWRSTTLNPYYEGNALNEMVTDDRFMFHTLDYWIFHEDFTGNLINVANIDNMSKRCIDEFPDGVHLITADGSIDCAARPDAQEEIVARLFTAEILTALSTLGAGGNFVIKMFTLFEACSVSLLYMLNCIFNEVHIYKPATSKRGNSEVYVICLNYLKDSAGLTHLLQDMRAKLNDPNNPMVMPLFTKSQIPKDFLLQHEICCRLFMNLQCDAIEKSIYAYESNDKQYFRHIHQLRSLVSAMYYNRYHVRSLADDLCIVRKEETNKALGFWMPVYGGSYTERQSLKHGDLLKQIYCLRRELNQVEKCTNGATICTCVEKRQELLKVHLTKSTPISKLQSSLFVTEPLLLLRFRILETLDIDPIWQTAPKCELGNKKEISYQPLNDDEPYYKTQQRFFLALLESLLDLKPEKLVFQNLVFLTHYAVSLLLFLTNEIYESTEFDNNSHTITLTGLIQNKLKQMHQLMQLMSDENAHSILNIKELHKNQFSSVLLQYNNGVLLACYRRLLGEDSLTVAVNLNSTPLTQQVPDNMKETAVLT
ncbi:cap-specific mRNA (nucleoside-2'-O-)-methyltransferase 2 [Scaptodrosophila lebanonensis]|uniref:Cap-specific mRNA (nucleoside-2'-O-)-methyltransferase 2 n=1 Tax=Drosophila lebanonensis TaxID=7225 RepID=A0A6J2UJB9_DROLE|nr:cap-specific mRNA (nucleoside-2'-O-)-methyltransferase 2 [Scaptodrosophila lebanonensis]